MSSHHRGEKAYNPPGKKAKLLSPGILHDYPSLSDSGEAIAEVADSNDNSSLSSSSSSSSSSSLEDVNESILPDSNPEDFIPGEIWATKESVKKCLIK